MDYRIRRTKHELDSTGYIEIGPGRYSGMHRQDSFVFVAEGILAKYLPDYDHFGMNDVREMLGDR